MRSARLPVPVLDDRRYQDLVDQAFQLASRICPEWTSREAGDPGVMLVEIFAWMFDVLLYRLNQVPDTMYTHFLNMVGVTPRPGSVATVDVDFYVAQPTAVTIPAGTQVATMSTEDEDPRVFTTLEQRHLRPATLIALAPSDGHSQPVAEPGNRATTILPTGRRKPLAFGFEEPMPGAIVRIDVELAGDLSLDVAVWEYSTAEGWQHAQLIQDTTGGLRHGGELTLSIGRDHTRRFLGDQEAAWLRLTAQRGDDGDVAPRPCVLTFAAIGLTVAASHVSREDGEEVGVCDGRPDQRFSVAHAPVLQHGSGERVVVGGDIWTAVESLAQSLDDDLHFQWDRDRGELRFGDGRKGRVPPSRARVVASYWHGGGAAGNVAAGAVSTLLDPLPYIVRLDNRSSAVGGRDSEPVEQARRRAPGLLHSGGRAVTAADYEHLALEADPRVARARCFPPTDKGGAVRLLLVPHTSSNPLELAFEEFAPEADIFEKVVEYIDERRTLGTRLIIEPPLFQGVTVMATVAAQDSPGTVAERAAAALNRYLHPVLGGRDGQGWPFGRPVIAGELFGVLLDVAGVDVVEKVQLAPSDPIVGTQGEVVDRIDIGEHDLVFPGRHHVRVI